MKMRKLLAFVLTGTLSLQNAMWTAAKAPQSQISAEGERGEAIAASPSDADPRSTDVNMSFNNGAVTDMVTWEEYDENIYCGQNYEATIFNHGDRELTLAARVVPLDGETDPPYPQYCGTAYGNGVRPDKISIPGKFFSKEGLYEITLVDDDNISKVYSAPVTVKVRKLPSMTILLTSNVFSGIHYQETLSKDTIYYSQYNVLQTTDNVQLGEVSLTNVTADCVKDPKSDTYVIREMRSEQCDHIIVEENEYAHPVIKKQTLESFSLKPEEMSIYEKESISLETVIVGEADENGIVWESSDNQIAFVDSKGTVTGGREGTAVITAKLQGLEAACKVTVKKKVESISLKPAVTDTNSGRVYQMAVSVEPAHMTSAVVGDIRWSSSDKEVAEVDQNGRVTTHKPGTCRIKAELGGEFAEYPVRVIEAHSLEVRVMADGYEKVIELAGKDVLTEKNYFEAGKEPESLELKKLPDGLKKYFDQEPVTEGMTVKFKLKPSAEAFQIDIPMSMKGGVYTEYNNDCVLRISGRPWVNVPLRTDEDILEFYRAHPFKDGRQERDTWDIEPDLAQNVAGKLSGRSVENVLNALNFVRYAAGVSGDVVSSEELEERVQAGAALLPYTSGKKPTADSKKPEGISEELFQKGIEGLQGSAYNERYRSITNSLLFGWMDCGDEKNIGGVISRRLCLSPYLKKTGFGRVDDWMVMCYREEDEEQISNYNFIPWPAQYTPVEYFEGPWSVSLNPRIYDPQKAENVTVTLTCGGKEWVLNESNKDKEGKFFHISSVNTGLGPAVIFQLDEKFHIGDRVDVKINGFKDSYGNDLPIEYTVNFFSMKLKPAGSLTLDTQIDELTVNWKFTLSAFIVQPDGSEVPAENVKWSSSDEGKAVVNSEGQVWALSPGDVTITAEVDGKTATCVVTIKSRKGSTGGSGGSGGSSGGSFGGGGGNSGGSGGSGSGVSGGGSSGGGSSGGSSGGGGGSGSSGGSSNKGGPSGSSGGSSLPSYVIMGTWNQVNEKWQFTDTFGVLYKNRWAAVVNPYANTAAGQEGFDWFFFDADGNMATGWHLDSDGNYYYLNSASDGTMGRMMTGWTWISDEAGVNRCYYLNPNSDGTRGRRISNTVVEGYTINQEGQWTVDGIVQSR